MKWFRLAAVLAVLVGMLGGHTAFAAPANTPAHIRVAELEPGTAPMDVYVASVADPANSFTAPGVAYGTVSDYRTVPAATYVVIIRPAGAPADSPAVIVKTFTARAGSAYTLAKIGPDPETGLTVLDDDLTMPPAGQSRVRVINAAPTSPLVDLRIAGGPDIATRVGLAESTVYRSLPAGKAGLVVGSPTGATVLLPIQLDSGVVYTAVLLDRPGGLAVELHPDGVGSPITPQGGVETGYGGLSAPPAPTGLLLAVAATAMASVAVQLRPRRRGRHGRR